MTALIITNDTCLCEFNFNSFCVFALSPVFRYVFIDFCIQNTETSAAYCSNLMFVMLPVCSAPDWVLIFASNIHVESPRAFKVHHGYIFYNFF